MQQSTHNNQPLMPKYSKKIQQLTYTNHVIQSRTYMITTINQQRYRMQRCNQTTAGDNHIDTTINLQRQS